MTIVTDFRYLDDLHLVRFRSGDGKLFMLSHEYRVSFRLDGIETVYTVPAGTKTDLASIPKFVPRAIAEKVDKHIEAAVVHDLMCVKRPYTSAIAADVFDAGMLAAGVPAWRRKLMAQAVRMFGPQW